MDTIYIGIVLIIIEVGIVVMIKHIISLHKQTKNSIDLLGIKHESWVEAYGYYEKNGLLNKYNELVEKKKSDKNFIKEI